MIEKSQIVANQFNKGDQSPRVVRHQNPMCSENMSIYNGEHYNNSKLKVENILKGSLDLIPSPSPSVKVKGSKVKIQIMGG